MRALPFVLGLILALLALGAWWTLRSPSSAGAAGGSSATHAVASGASETPPHVDAPDEPAGRRMPDEAAPLAAVLGNVRFESGSPAAGVPIRLFAHSGGAAPLVRLTDEDGHFELVLEAGTWQLGGGAPEGYLPWCEELRLAPDDALVVEHVLRQPGSLCIRVWCEVEGVAQPLVGARVAVALGLLDGVEQRSWRAEAPLAWANVDDEGRASVGAMQGAAQMLFIEAPGFAPGAVLVDSRGVALDDIVQEDRCAHVFLDRRGAPLRGRVVTHDGEPLADAWVAVSAPFVEERGYSLDFAQHGERAEQLGRIVFTAGSQRELARTAADGRFELHGPSVDGAPRRAFALVVHPGRDDFPHHQVQELDLYSMGQPLEVTVRVERGYEYELELVDEHGGALDGLVSLRDPDGRAHAPAGRLLEQHLEDSCSDPWFVARDGRLRVRHAGGPVSIGLVEAGQAREAALVSLPFGGASGPVRVTFGP